MVFHGLPQLAVHDLLGARASAMGEKQAFRFIPYYEGEERSVTYRALHGRTMAIAGEVQALAGQGERCAAVISRPVVDFVAAFLVASMRASRRCRSRASHAGDRSTVASGRGGLPRRNPSLVLSTAAHRKLAEQTYPHVPRLLQRPWVATDSVPDDRRQNGAGAAGRRPADRISPIHVGVDVVA